MGSPRDLDGVHFVLCYVQGMESFTALGLAEFDPGVQGEDNLLAVSSRASPARCAGWRTPKFRARWRPFCNDLAGGGYNGQGRGEV